MFKLKMSNIEQQIQQKLAQISQKSDLHFLLAVESGSRAWGFPSPDSDYDVRVIFIRPMTDYLSIDIPKDTFEYIENEWFDVGGWDLRKALNLLRKSNAVLLEWLNSPIVYQKSPQFVEQIRPLLREYFQPMSVILHYRGIARNALSQLDLNNEIKLKKWFYILRPLLAVQWVIQQNSIPPMELSKLQQMLPQALQNEIDELVQLKATQSENYRHKLSSNLIQLTEQLWQSVEYLQISSENKPLAAQPLDELFINMLELKKEYAHN
ncbi:nucleotidyltransferase domain-containing protein [Mannheimia indoligenes]|uniref:nucleotidyltransferase domain-containing protein n=1 Tax=Mannheimia indoligenes TaxID=3103145 RepID=UPI002FE67045